MYFVGCSRGRCDGRDVVKEAAIFVVVANRTAFAIALDSQSRY